MQACMSAVRTLIGTGQSLLTPPKSTWRIFSSLGQGCSCEHHSVGTKNASKEHGYSLPAQSVQRVDQHVQSKLICGAHVHPAEGKHKLIGMQLRKHWLQYTSSPFSGTCLPRRSLHIIIFALCMDGGQYSTPHAWL